MPELLITFYGDDFTGSTDALECLARAGARTVLFIEPPTSAQLARYPGLQAVGVAGMTRSLTPPEMEATLRPALSALRGLGAPHVHYKVCSTFDSSPTIGSIGRVIDLGAELFGAPFVPLLVAAPVLGRHCVFGNLFARFGNEGTPFRLDRHPSMSRHPITPADESDLRLHLARQTRKRIGLFDILKLRLPPKEARKALDALLREGPEIVLFDALYEEQLADIGQLIDGFASTAQPLFSVGSSGLDMALCSHWAAQGKLRPTEHWLDPGPAEPLLVASGSCSPVTESQIGWALNKGFVEIAIDTAALADTEDTARAEQSLAAETARYLAAGRSVIVDTSKGNADPRIAATARALSRRGSNEVETKALSARLLGGALGRIVGNALAQTRVKRLCIAGGDTSGHVAHALGIAALEMIAPVVPGAPLCRAWAPGSVADGLELNFKGGQVGGPDYFGLVARGRSAYSNNHAN